ncbi:hypothetical protein HYH02_002413 [Chlamydomonas schloesseri]|uniref:Protein kinase domain-containing protein n=1 Tax=Chlamydomonas schloesseri TaxID=2026947 RepID=A0A836BAY4_9CHLO|nr:hypothetical protein HYH02_002413 [Chlamydomonas schloesseri]|eukprot:KAG2453081.1 hypothetical protein HYH02_002413 [Chlamydomonas schloesseri]
MSFFARCISGSSLKGLVDQGDEDLNTTSTTNTPNDTAHGGSKFGSLSWKRLSTRSSRSSLNSPKKPFGSVSTPPSSLASSGTRNDGGAAAPRPSMEPVMERTRSALTDLEAVKFLIEDWSHKHWRPATPQDQECFDRIDQRDIKPLVALGEGAYGSVNLCRIPMSRLPCGGSSSSAAAAAGGRTVSATGHTALPRHAMSQRELATSSVPVGPSAPSNAPSNRSSSSGGALPQQEQPQQAGLGSAPPPPGAHRPHHQRAASSAAAFGQRSRTTSLTGGAMEDVPAIEEEPGAGEAEAAQASGSGGGAGPGMPPPVAEGSAGSTVAEEAAGSSPATLSSSSAASGSSGPAAELDPGAKRGSSGGGATTAADAAGSAGAAAGAAALTPASSVNDPQLIVAVKRVPLGWNQERELMQLHRCQQCPFIVRLFGFVEDGDEHCSYVMEWAEGGDLAGMLMSLKDRRGANKQRLLMSEASARYYMGCLLLALEFLHNNGLLHRDIKPSNLLLTSDGTAKLADLGFTVALDANGLTVGCCGTTGYIAPEVYAYGTNSKTRSSYGIPADIWSAAATLFQALTGSVVTDQPEEVLKKGWRPPTHPRFSPQLQDLLNRMLAAKPSSRPQSVASVMRHAWFAGFDWAALREGRMTAPYVPRERRQTRPEPPTGAAAPTGAGSSSSAGAAGGPAFAQHSSGAGLSAGSSGGPPPASPGGQRLATVMERMGADGSNRGASEAPAAGAAGGGEEIEVPRSSVQRSALSLRDEASVHRGREGLVRDASSFDTALDTVPTVEAEAAAAHSMAVAALAGAAAVGSGHGGLAHAAAAADGTAHGTADNGPSGPLQHGHGRVHGHVRFAMGVAECA